MQRSGAATFEPFGSVGARSSTLNRLWLGWHRNLRGSQRIQSQAEAAEGERMSDASQRYRNPQDVLAFIAAAPRRTINAKQLASRLGVSRTTLWRLRQRDNAFPKGVKHPAGKAVRFDLRDVEAYERVRAVKHKMQTSVRSENEEPTQ